MTANMQKAKPCTLSIYNFGSTLLSVLPNVFPLGVKKMLRCLNPWGGNKHPLCGVIPRAPRKHTQPMCRIPQIPLSRWLCGVFLSSWVPAVFPQLPPSLADWSPPRYARIHPHSWGRKGIWLEVSWGSTWRNNQMAFTAAPLLPRILKRDLPTGACKRAG